MPQLLQHVRLSLVFLVLGIVFLVVGVYKIVISTQPVNSTIKVVRATENKVDQNTKNSSEIYQKDTSTASPSADIFIMVDVSGSVVRPGVYKLDPGSRISQAIQSAGGISPKADANWIAKNLNQATKLNDGDKIFIPALGEGKSLSLSTPNTSQTIPIQPSTPQVAGISIDLPGLQKALASVSPQTASPTQTPSDGKVNINSATSSELDTLPGVGPVTAQKIIDNRPYKTLEELKEKKAVNKTTFEKIKDKVKL